MKQIKNGEAVTPILTAEREPFVGVKDAAEYLGVSESTVLKYLHAKVLPASQLGDRWLLKLSELDEWHRNQVQSSRHNRPTGEKR